MLLGRAALDPYKSIHSAEFFHGMLEIVDRDTPVTVFVGEDAQRSLSERVVKFLPRVCANYTVIDSKDYELKGISEEFRGNLSHLVTHAVTQRIDAHLEQDQLPSNGNQKDINRQFDY